MKNIVTSMWNFTVINQVKLMKHRLSDHFIEEPDEISSKIKYLNTVQKEKVYDILQSIKLKSTFNNFNKFQKINPCKWLVKTR